MISKGFAINLAPTGVVANKRMTSRIPVSHEEILLDVAECLELGVQLIHLHARDENEKQTSDPEPYGRLIESIRKLPGGQEAILCVTTSGRCAAGLGFRSRVLDLDGDMKPDMASLTLSSMNFMQSASMNAPGTVRALAQKMQENGIRAELEVFDLGMANFAQVLVKEGLLTSPCYVNLLLGNISSAQTELLHSGTLLASLPEGCFVSIAGLGRYQLQANLLGLMFADGVRTGLEDNIWLDQARQQLAANADLVRRILQMAAKLERPLLPRAELRKILKMEKNRQRNEQYSTTRQIPSATCS